MTNEPRPPLPPFTEETARQKVRLAQDAWNTRNAERVALAYTADSQWRNRHEFLQGREAIVAFLKRKWERELDYRLVKQLWSFGEDRIAVRFSMNGMMPQDNGIARMGTSYGNSTLQV